MSKVITKNMIIIVRSECFNIEKSIRIKWITRFKIADWSSNSWRSRKWFNDNNKILLMCAYDELRKAFVITSKSNKLLIKIWDLLFMLKVYVWIKCRSEIKVNYKLLNDKKRVKIVSKRFLRATLRKDYTFFEIKAAKTIAIKITFAITIRISKIVFRILIIWRMR